MSYNDHLRERAEAKHRRKRKRRERYEKNEPRSLPEAILFRGWWYRDRATSAAHTVSSSVYTGLVELMKPPK